MAGYIVYSTLAHLCLDVTDDLLDRLPARRMPPLSKSRRKFRFQMHVVPQTDPRVSSTKQHAIDQGGKIGHEYKIIKGFSYVVPPPYVNLPLVECLYIC
jgi:hypothetical protein